MSATPAAHLARLRKEYGGRWRVDSEDGRQQETAAGPGFIGPATYTAVNRTKRTGL